MTLKIKNLFLIILLFCFLSSETSASKPVSDSADQIVPAQPISQEKEKVVAKVFGKKILLSEIIPETGSLGQYESQLTLGQKKSWSEKERNEKLSALILGPLVEEYAKTHNITSSDEEINAFVKQTEPKDPISLKNLRESEEGYKRHLKQLRERKKMLDDELLQPNLRKETKQKILEELDLINKGLSYRFANLQQESSQRVASVFLRAWKLNKSLYEQYGGRVIFQQAGPEPVDAYRDFLKEHETKGDFEIYDENLKKSFWAYFIDDGHSFYSKEEGEKVMQIPWWEIKAKPKKIIYKGSSGDTLR